jgi:beta-lactamase regulating signal transducer with metallopeptidase domain
MTTSEEAAAGVATPIHWSGLLGALWLAGSVVWMLVAGYRLQRFWRLLRFTEPAPAMVQDQANRLSRHLGLASSPGVWFTSASLSPMLWAFFGAPRLLVPVSLWNDLAEEERDTLLMHELAHWRRRDHWVRLLELAVLALYWWHPVVWWARRELRDAEEVCCDALVLTVLPTAAPAYARALVETVAFLSHARSALPLAASGIGQVTILKRRLTMIMRGTTAAEGLGWATLLLVLGAGALLLPLWPSWAQPLTPRAVVEPEALVQEPVQPAATPPAATLQPTTPAPVARPPRLTNLAPQADNAQSVRDEIELLEAQVQIRKAEVSEVGLKIAIAQRRRDRIRNLAGTGAISSEEQEKAQDDVELLKAQLAPKEAQLHEAEVRLRQARRHVRPEARRPEQAVRETPSMPMTPWAAVANPAPGTATPPAYPVVPATTAAPAMATPPAYPAAPATTPAYSTPAPVAANPTLPWTTTQPKPTAAPPMAASAATDHEQRLQNLERKMDALLKEISALRRELRPERRSEKRQPDNEVAR